MKRILRKIIIAIFLTNYTSVFSQDASFSQSDLGSLYMNPAYTGASGDPTFLSIRKMQWTNYDTRGIRPFTTSLAEISFAIDAGNRGAVGLRTIGLGLSFMAEDHSIIPDILSNTIFLRRKDYQFYLSGLYKIGRTRSFFKNGGTIVHYFQPAISYGQSIYALQTDGIVTSGMITPYTLSYSNLPDPSISIQDLAINRKPFNKLVIGFLHSIQGNTSSSQSKRTETGFSFQRMTEGFNNSLLTSKIIFHIKHQGSISPWRSKIINYWNSFAKRELYYTGSPFSNKIMAKTEYGGSLELGRIEIGSLFRFNSNYIDYKSDINWQTYAPFIRFNLPYKKNMFQFSYCTDLESTFLTNIEDNLYIKNTGVTHEISFSITFWTYRSTPTKECIKYGVMKDSKILNDIKNNKIF